MLYVLGFQCFITFLCGDGWTDFLVREGARKAVPAHSHVNVAASLLEGCSGHPLFDIGCSNVVDTCTLLSRCLVGFL